MAGLPFFHEASESVRFWVPLGDGEIGAAVNRHTLHHRFTPGALGSDPMATFNAHRAELEEAVRRRVDRGSIEPVFLREFDLK